MLEGVSLDQAKAWIIEQVMWAEVNMRGKSGKEKRDAVVARLDEIIKLPFYLEWLDDKIIGLAVDIVCNKLNVLYSHHFENAEMNKELTDKIDLPEDLLKGGE